MSALLTPEETNEALLRAGFEELGYKDISDNVLKWFENENKEIKEGRPVGGEHVYPSWPEAVASQIANLQNEHIKFACLTHRKIE